MLSLFTNASQTTMNGCDISPNSDAATLVKSSECVIPHTAVWGSFNFSLQRRAACFPECVPSLAHPSRREGRSRGQMSRGRLLRRSDLNYPPTFGGGATP
jgi:hypothetical protein